MPRAVEGLLRDIGRHQLPGSGREQLCEMPFGTSELQRALDRLRRQERQRVLVLPLLVRARVAPGVGLIEQALPPRTVPDSGSRSRGGGLTMTTSATGAVPQSQDSVGTNAEIGPEPTPP